MTDPTDKALEFARDLFAGKTPEPEPLTDEEHEEHEVVNSLFALPSEQSDDDDDQRLARIFNRR